MLRAKEILLTLAAFFIFIGSSDLKARVIQASASSPIESIEGSTTTTTNERTTRSINEPLRSEISGGRKSEADIDLLMGKVRKGLENNQIRRLEETELSNSVKQIQNNNNNNNFPITTTTTYQQQVPKKDGDSQNLYNYFANKTSSEKNSHLNESLMASVQKPNDFRKAQEVRIEFLRSSFSHPINLEPNSKVHSSGSSGSSNKLQRPVAQHRVQNTSLYLLNYAPLSLLGGAGGNLQAPRFYMGPANDDDTSVRANEVEVSEQQQQPPFTMFPPYSQQQQQFNNANSLPQNNIRQILNNYQRNHNTDNNNNNNRIGHQANRNSQNNVINQNHQAPRNPYLPALQPNNGGSTPTSGVPQPPFSPLQLLTGPLQALLPGAFGQAPQQQHQVNNQVNNHHQQQQQHHAPRTSNRNNHHHGTRRGSSTRRPEAASIEPPPTEPVSQNPAAGPIAPPSSSQLPALFNPFGLNPQQQLAGQIPQQQQQQQQQQPGQLPNLQTLYQQLPLYQALLAARQRQEALEAAQKLRQQQQLQQTSGPPGLRPPASLPGFNPQQAFGGYQPQNQQQLPQQPYGLQNNPYLGLNNANQPAQQPPNLVAPLPQAPQQPTQNPNVSPVQFDDDPQNQNQNNVNNQQPASGQGQANNDDNNNNNNNGDNDNTNNNNNNENNENNHNNQQQQQQNENQDNGGQNNDQSDNNNDSNSGNQDNQGGGDSGGGRQPEEEDPDLKQFQNLANGGDSFTDLFPPGILSNNDISDIRKQQDEQAKKQEQEERQRQLQNQQQQQQQQQPQPVQPQFEQPINQFANNNQEQNNGSGNNNNNNNNADQPNEEEENNNNNNGDNNNAEGGNNEPEAGGGNPEGSEDEGGQENDNPEAAALTAKSESSGSASSGHQTSEVRFKQSPGVVYSNETSSLASSSSSS